MIRRGFRRTKPAADQEVGAQGFDAFELRLGDIMRGERATMGKSLLDVQRELKIKAAYIAAIENADPTAFDTPGFIAGYVRSYARYLNMDADWAFETFCQESGFQTAHGMSDAASVIKQGKGDDAQAGGMGRDIFSASATPFIPAGEKLLSKIEPRAVGSIAVLLVVLSGLGYGGWTVLQEVQKVQFAPVDQVPTVLADIDPLAGGTRPEVAGPDAGQTDVVIAPSPDALDRLYRPRPLDVPQMVPRDGPIVAIDRTGLISPEDDVLPVQPEAAPVVALADDTDGGVASGALDAIVAEAAGIDVATTPRVTEAPVPEVVVVAAREAWVRVTAPDGSTLFEGVMQPGDSYVVPTTEEPATLRVGESGAIYFAVNGVHYGPAGPRGAVTSNIALASAELQGTYQPADIAADDALAEIVRVAEVQALVQELDAATQEPADQ